MAFLLDSYEECGFCRYIRGEAFSAVVAESELALAFVNHRQYERGAALVIPRRHVETIVGATDAELAAMSHLARNLAAAAERAFGAIAANVFQNNGVKAGQHVPHMHTHVGPDTRRAIRKDSSCSEISPSSLPKSSRQSRMS